MGFLPAKVAPGPEGAAPVACGETAEGVPSLGAPRLVQPSPSAQDPASSEKEKQDKRKASQNRNKVSFLAVAKWYEAYSKKCWQERSWPNVNEVGAEFEVA